MRVTAIVNTFHSFIPWRTTKSVQAKQVTSSTPLRVQTEIECVVHVHPMTSCSLQTVCKLAFS